MIAVLAGGTGLTGKALLKELLQDPAITKVKAIVRRSLQTSHSKLEEVFLQDLSQLESLGEQLRGDFYFCCLGTTIKKAGSQDAFRQVDYEAVLEFAKIAHFHKAQAFACVSAMGADSNSTFFYNRVKGDVEQALQALGLHNLIIIKPGLLVGPREEHRTAEVLATKLLTPFENLLPSTLTKKIITHDTAVARRMLHEAKRALPGVFIFPAARI